MFRDKKAEEAEKLIIKHFGLVQKVLVEFQKMVHDYVTIGEGFKEDAYQVHKLEHKADTVRRNIALKLYEGAFMPIFREDYILLAEVVDEVANLTESASDFIVLTRPMIPEFLQQNFLEMVDATTDSYVPLTEALEMFNKDLSHLMEMTRKVGDKEQAVDEIFWELTKKLFKSRLDKAEKLHLQQLFDRIAQISNIVEDAADRLEIMAVKRRA